MHITVLGPLQADLRGHSILPAGTKPRQLLALLAVNHDQVVPITTLMDEIWGTNLPRSAVNSLQTYVMQIRRRIADVLTHPDNRGPDGEISAKDILLTTHCGYQLRTAAPRGGTPTIAVDVTDFEELVARGRTEFTAGHLENASDLLRQALDLWSAPFLVDVRHGAVLTVDATRLAETRLTALELRIDTDLRLGRHTTLLAELAALLAQNPLHEGLHALAMLAYYRSGRQADALRVYRDLRLRLIDDLGLEPCARLGRLHQAILAADLDLDLQPTIRSVPQLVAAKPKKSDSATVSQLPVNGALRSAWSCIM